MNNLTLVFEKNEQPMTDSLKVAEYFNKRHADTLRSLESLECSPEFTERNFALSSYRSEQNKRQPMYLMTRDGFTLLAMGYTGKKAMAFKEAYIAQFNKMAAFITQLNATKHDSRELTEAIGMAHKELHSYHYSTEFDLINRVALGMSSKKFRRLNGITGNTIRPFLTAEQLECVNRLQRFDSGLVLTIPNYNDRKAILMDYYNRFSHKALLKAANE